MPSALRHVELRWLKIPLVTPFRTSRGLTRDKDTFVLRVVVETEHGEAEGWAECGADLEPVYSEEWLAGCALLVETELLPRLLAAPEVTADGVAGILEPVRGNPLAKHVVETAILDAELKAAGVSFASRLGAVRDRVLAGVSIGIPGSIPELLDLVGGYLEDGYGRIKLKIQPGWDVEPVAAVRERYGDELMLQVDANQAYSLADADGLDRLAELDSFGLQLIEQPLPMDDLLGHADLARRLRTPLCLDESIVSLRTADAAIRLGATAIINIKPARVGGYLEAVRIHDLALAHDVPVWCGGMLETGVGRAANLALAALPGFTLPGDTSATRRYFAEDITRPFELVDGEIEVPSGPGIGVDVDIDALERFTVSRHTLV